MLLINIIIMSNVAFIGGHCSTSGRKIFTFPSDTQIVPRGVDLDKVYTDNLGIIPENEFRSGTWTDQNIDGIEQPTDDGVMLSDTKWIKERARGNQHGYRASEVSQYGPEWYPISNTVLPSRQSEELAPETVNINSASFLSGLSVLPPRLGKDIRGADRVLQRNPGDLLVTTSRTYDSQSILCPGGRNAGYAHIGFVGRN